MSVNPIAAQEMGICDLLDHTGLMTRFEDVMLLYGDKKHLKPDRVGASFITSKLDELKAYVNANKKDGTTRKELKALISGWFDEQERIADEIEQVEEIEPAKQSEVKT